MSSYDKKEMIDGHETRHYLAAGRATSAYTAPVVLGRGVFRIGHAHVEIVSTVTYAVPVSIVFTWNDDRGSEQEDCLGSGFVSGSTRFSVTDLEVIGPGTLQGWCAGDGTLEPWLTVAYRRVRPYG